MKTLKTACTLAAGLLAIALAPAAALAQTDMSTPQARWENWKAFTSNTQDEHYAKLKQAANGGTHISFETRPDWTGLWTSQRGGGAGVPSFRTNAAGGPPGAPGAPPVTPLSERPSLTPEYQKRLNEELDRVSRGIEWDYLSYCLPAGFPRWLTEPFLREFIVTPEETWMTNEQQSETRRVYTDGRDHIPADEAFPLFEGDSIGFWDGDILVVSTKYVKPGTWNRSAPEYSDKTETVEQIRKIDDKTIEDRITVYDPESLTKPWHIVFRSNKLDDQNKALRINMWSCNENNNVVNQNGLTNFVLPGESAYKDPTKFALPPGSQDPKAKAGAKITKGKASASNARKQ